MADAVRRAAPAARGDRVERSSPRGGRSGLPRGGRPGLGAARPRGPMGRCVSRRRARRLRRLADRATPPHVSPAARESDARAAFGARALHRGRGRAGRRGNGRTRSRAAPERLSYSYYSIDDAAEWVTVVEAPGRHPIGAPWVKDPAELTLCPTLPTSDRRGRKASQRCNSLRGCLWQTGPAGIEPATPGLTWAVSDIVSVPPGPSPKAR